MIVPIYTADNGHIVGMVANLATDHQTMCGRSTAAPLELTPISLSERNSNGHICSECRQAYNKLVSKLFGAI